MTTTTSPVPVSDSLILKSDTRGRVLTPPERREQLLDEFERSGLSGAKYAALVGIKYQTFAAWAYRRRLQRGSAKTTGKARPGAEQVRWLEAVVEEAQAPKTSSRAGLVLHLPGGVRAEILEASQAQLAAVLVRALEKPC